jgi:hypothetical protein
MIPGRLPRREGKASQPKKLQTFNSIATAYRQYEFRSRLEAKWAVFFDLCGWSWSYEPIDLNGWIPDFAIGERPVLVEVKPFFGEDEWDEAKAKIVASGCRQPVVLLGCDPVWLSVEEEFCNAPTVGWIFEAPVIDENGTEVHGTWPLNFGITEGNHRPGLCSMIGAWWNVIWKAPSNCNAANKWSRVSLYGNDIETELVERWAKASNVSQWIPKRDNHRS